MQRSHAFMLSAFLTVLVTGAFFALAGQARARSAAQPEPVEVAAADDDAPYLAQEQALQTNIAQLQQTLASMNTEYSKKVQTAQSNVEIGQEAISAREAGIAELQSQVQAMQATLDQDAQAYAQQMAALQANEAQLRQQLEGTLAALQAAYNDLAAQQAAQASSSGGGGGGGGGGNNNASYNDDDDHGEHEEREHEEREHGDDHGGEREHDDD